MGDVAQSSESAPPGLHRFQEEVMRWGWEGSPPRAVRVDAPPALWVQMLTEDVRLGGWGLRWGEESVRKGREDRARRRRAMRVDNELVRGELLYLMEAIWGAQSFTHPRRLVPRFFWLLCSRIKACSSNLWWCTEILFWNLSCSLTVTSCRQLLVIWNSLLHLTHESISCWISHFAI